ncbi:MAG: glucosaminidase domain-containing protein [Flavobacterium sp.]|nr:glucosaminidase domain-containing protein [Candidatus Neoflavobacterium equi]
MRSILFCLALIICTACGSSNGKVRVSKSSSGRSSSSKTASTKATTKKGTTTTNKNASGSANSKTEVLEATSVVNVGSEGVKTYISKFKSIAQDNMRSHKIPASITMAQGILESGSGVGTLSMKANNHFGIKCHTDWTGPSVRHDDDAAQECFRKYDDPADSYRDHSLFLTTRARYNSLFNLDISDYKSWAKGLKTAGYATDSKYPDKLISLIERYQLYELDQEVIKGKDYVAKPIVSAPTTTAPSKNVAAGNLYTVQQGETLYSISKKFNTTVDRIKELNNLTDNTLSIGQQLNIQ